MNAMKKNVQLMNHMNMDIIITTIIKKGMKNEKEFTNMEKT